MKNKVNITAHSLSPQGDELITVLATFPRIILAEINTHRMLSKNTSSSRAIPFKKMVESVQNNPFIPIAWQKEHTGMQGTEYLQPPYHEDGILLWLEARDKAVESAIELNSYGITKQLCNRLLEPFMWTTMLITGSRESWNIFFNLRCHDYEGFKSRKEASKEFLEKGDIDTSNWSELDWLHLNKGQAEIHMMALSEAIYDAMNESTPKQLKAGEWHLPMLPKEAESLSIEDKLKWCVGIHANTSYTVVGDGKMLTLEHASKIHDKCKKEVHSSVFEHCARAMSDEEYVNHIKGVPDMIDYEKDEIAISYLKTYEDSPEAGWCNNLKGFIPYRYFIDNKIEI